jgi:hypothetical protein
MECKQELDSSEPFSFFLLKDEEEYLTQAVQFGLSGLFDFLSFHKNCFAR